MGGKKVKITDLATKLGLRAPVTKSKAHWEWEPNVRKLYEAELDRLSASFVGLANDDLRSSQDFRLAVLHLLEKYGPIIWRRAPDNAARRWLCSIEDKGTNSLYPKDLYYDDLNDRAVLGDVLCELATHKAIRWRNDKGPSYDRREYIASDATWRPQQESSSRKSLGIAPPPLMCIATALDDGRRAHDNATYLEEQGVWLGVGDDAGVYSERIKQAIDDHKSFDDVIEDYFARTEGGTTDDKARGLHTNQPHPSAEWEKGVQCAACMEQGLSTTTSEDGATQMTIEQQGMWSDKIKYTERNVWTFSCFLRGRKVAAFVKYETRKSKKLGPSTALWSFWSEKQGRYIPNMYLATVGGKGKEKVRAPILRSDLVDGKSQRKSQSGTPTQSNGPASVGSIPLRQRSGLDAGSDQVRALAAAVEGGSIQWAAVNSLRTDAREDPAHTEADVRTTSAEQVLSADRTGKRIRRPTLHFDEIGESPRRVRPRVEDASVQREGSTLSFNPIPEQQDETEAAEHDSAYSITPGYEPDRKSIRSEDRIGQPISEVQSHQPGLFRRFAQQAYSAHRTSPVATDSESQGADEERRKSVPQHVLANQQPAVATSSELLGLHEEGRETVPQRVPANPQPASAPTAPAGRIRMWLKLRDTVGRNVVMLDRSMSVEAVMEAVQKRKARKLEGRSVEELCIMSMNGNALEEPITMEAGDPDTWETVVDMVLSGVGAGGVAEIEAIVEV